MSELSIRLEGFPEKVQRMADALEDAFPGMLTWSQSEDETNGIVVIIDGYEILRCRRNYQDRSPHEQAPRPCNKCLAFEPSQTLASSNLLLNAGVWMTWEQTDRIILGWSCEQLARASGVSIAAIYLLERMGSAGPEDDARIRNALAQNKSNYALRNIRPAANDPGTPHQSDERTIGT